MTEADRTTARRSMSTSPASTTTAFNSRDETIGGPDNVLRRGDLAGHRSRADDQRPGVRRKPDDRDGHHAAGIPGYEPDMCDYCTYDAEAAQAAFDEWTAAGNTIDSPIQIQFNADAGHEDVVAIVVENLAAIGIDAESVPMPTEDYFTQMGEGGCVFCRSGWYADYPTYDNYLRPVPSGRRSVAATTATRATSSTPWSTRRRRRSTPTPPPTCTTRPRTSC